MGQVKRKSIQNYIIKHYIDADEGGSTGQSGTN